MNKITQYLIGALTVATLTVVAENTVAPRGVVEAQTQTFPLTIRVGVNPDTSSNPPAGYTLALDGAAPVDMGMPATVTCTTLSGGQQSPCIPFSVSIPAAGSHTVSVVAYNIDGSSAPTSITFVVTATTPLAPGNLRIIK